MNARGFVCCGECAPLASQAAHRWCCIRSTSTWAFVVLCATDIALRRRVGTERLRGTVAEWAIDSTIVVMCVVLQTQMCRSLLRLLNSKVSCSRVLPGNGVSTERGSCQAMGRRNARGVAWLGECLVRARFAARLGRRACSSVDVAQLICVVSVTQVRRPSPRMLALKSLESRGGQKLSCRAPLRCV